MPKSVIDQPKKTTVPFRALLAASILANVAIGAGYMWGNRTPQSKCAIISRTSSPPERSATTPAHSITRDLTIESSVSRVKTTLTAAANLKPVVANKTAEKPAAELIEQTLDALGGSRKKEAFEIRLAIWRRNFTEDTPDPVWSQMAEGQAGSYLAEILGPEFELIGIKCGRRMCEVQAASTSTENGEKAANDWEEDMSAMSREPWWTTYGFAVPNSTIWSAPDGRTLFVSYLSRGDEPDNP